MDYKWYQNGKYWLEIFLSKEKGELVAFLAELVNGFIECSSLYWPLDDTRDSPRVESRVVVSSVEDEFDKLKLNYSGQLESVESSFDENIISMLKWTKRNLSNNAVWDFALRQLLPADLDEGEQTPSVYPAKVKINPDRFSLFELKRKAEAVNKTVILDPEFQRSFVWNAKQKSELIESILMGIPLPVLYFFQQKDGKFQVVDGRQRLTTVFQFMNNKFALTGLEILEKENTKYFKDLDPLMQSTIEDYQMNVYTIQPPTPEKVKFDIFDRVNRSGTSLTHQEMRNALYQGKSTIMLKDLAFSEAFQNAIGYSIEHKRMKDRYIILRFIAFYMYFKKINGIDEIEYKSDIDDFLAKVMERINAFSDEKIAEIKNVFVGSMRRCFEIMGSDAFRFTNNGRRLPINMALFEVLAFFFADEKIFERQSNETVKDAVNKQKKEFFDSDFSKQVDSSTKVNERFNAIMKLQKELCDDR